MRVKIITLSLAAALALVLVSGCMTPWKPAVDYKPDDDALAMNIVTTLKATYPVGKTSFSLTVNNPDGDKLTPDTLGQVLTDELRDAGYAVAELGVEINGATVPLTVQPQTADCGYFVTVAGGGDYLATLLYKQNDRHAVVLDSISLRK